MKYQKFLNKQHTTNSEEPLGLCAASQPSWIQTHIYALQENSSDRVVTNTVTESNATETQRKLDSHDSNLVLFCALWLFICQKWNWWQPCTGKPSVQSKEHRNIVCLPYAEDVTKREQKIRSRHRTPLRSSVGNPSYFTCDTASSAAPSSCFPSGPSVTGTAGLPTTLLHSKDQIKSF